ncbi:MAG: lysozyme inhibitor LprI family protein [Rubricoccaceae bacterium]|nr:lysozyme inhibitor LprI family protein [Rubricoccaceae bacterium]
MRSFVLALALAAGAATAQDATEPTRIPVVIFHDDVLECDGADSPTFVACVRSTLATEDAELNRVYAAAMDSVRAPYDDWRTEAHEHSLRDAQRLWVAFKEQDCGDTVAVYEHWGGRWANTMGDVCRIVKTRVRTAELRLRYLTP